MGKLDDKICFIIAHKYFRGYESYLKYYIDNIFSFYENPLVLVVDNNSPNKDDIFNIIENDKVIFLENNIECKFELGAYQVGIDYLKINNLIDVYDYYIFTQDTYILKNIFDFNELKSNNINAASLIGLHNDWAKMDIVGPVLEKLNLLNDLDDIYLCWCNSFIISNKRLLDLQQYLQQIIIKTRHESEASERYLGKILFELNNHRNYAIDGRNNTFIVNNLSYDCHNVDVFSNTDKYFCKKAQQKNERTIER